MLDSTGSGDGSKGLGAVSWESHFVLLCGTVLLLVWASHALKKQIESKVDTTQRAPHAS